MDYREEARRFLEYMPKIKGPSAESKEKIEKISRGECNALINLRTNGGKLTSGELAKLCNVSSPRMATMVNGLEKKGYVKREAETKDKRKTYIILTKEGEEKVEVMYQHALEGMTKYFEYIGEKHVKELFELVELTIAFHENI